MEFIIAGAKIELSLYPTVKQSTRILCIGTNVSDFTITICANKLFSCIIQYTVEEQTRKNSNFPVRGIFKNPREIIVNISR